jgi:hypothetical protein
MIAAWKLLCALCSLAAIEVGHFFQQMQLVVAINQA